MMRKKFELADLSSIGRRLLVSAFVVAVAGTAGATEYHVSVSGSDSNSGTSTAPFKSIGKAASVMRAGDICTIHAGTYRETVTPGSGTSSAHLLFRAAAGDSVVIDGCDAVTATYLGSGRYTVPVSNQLPAGQQAIFYNGKRFTEARFPNTGPDPSRPAFNTIQSGTGSGTTAVTIKDSSLTQPTGYFVGARIKFASGPEPGFQTGVVTASSPGSITAVADGPVEYAFQAGNRYALTGLSSFVDADGEWAMDSNGTTATLYAPNSLPDASTTVEVYRRPLGFDLTGSSYVDLQGMNFFACTVKTSIYTSNDSIDRVRAEYVGIVDSWANLFYGWDWESTGIQLFGNNNKLTNSFIEYSDGYGVRVDGNNNLIRNNTVLGVGMAGPGASNIKVFGQGNQILNNTLANSGRNLLDLGSAVGSVASYNECFNGGLLGYDCGAIYLWHSPGPMQTIVSYNNLHDLYGGGVGMGGLYIDHNVYDVFAFRNVVWNAVSGVRMNTPTGNNIVVNNTVDLSTTHSFRMWPGVDLGLSTVENNYFPTWINTGIFDGTWKANATTSSPGSFSNPSQGNFLLSSGSSLVDAGVPVSGLPGTIFGTAPDIGAYEAGTSLVKYGAQLSTEPAPVSSVKTQVADGSITLRWVARPEATFYNIYRATSMNGNYSLVGSSQGSTNAGFVDTSNDADKSYYYYVTACNGYGESEMSEVVNTGVFFPGSGGGLQGSYYSDQSLTFSTSSLLNRTETINYDWGAAAPAPQVPADHFQARWLGMIEAPVTGSYTFTVISDDGMRLWFNGTKEFDCWAPSYNYKTFTVNLVGGHKYAFQMDYFENTGNAKAQLWWSYANHPNSAIPLSRLYKPLQGGLAGDYYNGANFDSYVYSHTDSQINFNWGLGSPDSRIGTNNFSIDWNGVIYIPAAGTYTFSTTADNCIRLIVDNKKLIDRWVNSAATDTVTTSFAAPGYYQLELEYAELGGTASVVFKWAPPGQSLTIIPAANLFHNPN